VLHSWAKKNLEATTKRDGEKPIADKAKAAEMDMWNGVSKALLGGGLDMLNKTVKQNDKDDRSKKTAI